MVVIGTILARQPIIHHYICYSKRAFKTLAKNILILIFMSCFLEKITQEAKLL